MKKVFIDGKAGTTGLRIFDRLAGRSDIELITLSDAQRKDVVCRKAALNSADIAFLCLPDAAAIDAVSMVDNPDTVIIDTSTAHRTSDGWVYGFPELSKKHEADIIASKRIAVPGCHASGFIALVYPLIEAGIIDRSTLLMCQSLTGYSGGGKKMIEQYSADERDPLLSAPRQYGLTQQHKHLKEMKAVTGIDSFPVFCPIVADFYSGMEVTVPLFSRQLAAGKTVDDIIEVYKSKYTGPMVSYCDSVDNDGFVSAATLSGKDSMHITVSGNSDRILLMAVYDNLGKGASGAAIECMNLVMNCDRLCGLDI
ncbi:MAG: N-acetyl-gamma-glutamyl-phosphate reductase [Firmicutes bacterium]|nr:N-acetyl-gamma-glutamyl-phosphate reductase [Bacillota bacterium]